MLAENLGSATGNSNFTYRSYVVGEIITKGKMKPLTVGACSGIRTESWM